MHQPAFDPRQVRGIDAGSGSEVRLRDAEFEAQLEDLRADVLADTALSSRELPRIDRHLWNGH